MSRNNTHDESGGIRPGLQDSEGKVDICPGPTICRDPHEKGRFRPTNDGAAQPLRPTTSRAFEVLCDGIMMRDLTPSEQ